MAGHTYLSKEGLVYQALQGSKVTNCSRAALTLLGAANAFGAREAPTLQWLKQQLEELTEAGDMMTEPKKTWQPTSGLGPGHAQSVFLAFPCASKHWQEQQAVIEIEPDMLK